MNNGKLQFTTYVIIGLILLGTVVYAFIVSPPEEFQWDFTSYKLKNFDSYEEFTSFLGNASDNNFYYSLEDNLAGGTRDESLKVTTPSTFEIEVDTIGGEIVDYSQTNIQVEGVDEPDIVKTDGTYLYIVSNGKIIIIKAYPTDDVEIVSKISLNDTLYVENIFIYKEKLIVFAQTYNYPIYRYDEKNNGSSSIWHSTTNTYVKIFDLTDIKNPNIARDIVMEGTYTGARMIDGYVYVISTQYSYSYGLPEDDVIIPKIMVNEDIEDISISDIYYVDIPEKSSTLTNIVSIDISDDSKDVHTEVFVLGDSHVLYVSKNNIYISYSSSYYDYEQLKDIIDELVLPILPESIKEEYNLVKELDLEDHQKKTVSEWILQNYVESLSEADKNYIAMEIIRQTERTIIHKIGISNGNIEYLAQGSIPGFVKNQFSLSEYNGFLRVSTTIEGWMVRYYLADIESRNNVYVLDDNLEIVGSLEDLAIDEQIYATRFIGDKCYLVTFKQIDPFFVIDLTDPYNPDVLGELKIPGFSTYLHTYDENHIIGIGRDEEMVKISLFDVSNIQNPEELDKYEIKNEGEKWYWTESSALYEHKAFLFDKEKNLLVIPVGSYSKESAYVFNISVEDGIRLKGTVTHDYMIENNDTIYESWDWDSYYYDYGNSIKRTLYIEDVLYTISNNMVKMNDLDTLDEIQNIILVE